MYTLNNVFAAVKEYCNSDAVSEDCFSKIAATANVSIEQLETMLARLQDLGLIKYNWQTHEIKMTTFGKRQDKVGV